MKSKTRKGATHEPARADSELSVDEQVLVELRRIIRAAQMSAKELARVAGLTTSQLVVLDLLKSHTAMTPGQIARAMNLTQATVTILLDRLQARGLIERQRGERDRRTVQVRLTATGKQRLAHAPQSLQQRFLAAFSRLEAWEKTYLLSALQRLTLLMDTAALDAAPLLEVGSIDRPAEAAEGDA
jgi:DNA-binding MarR family transcriptional regulator